MSEYTKGLKAEQLIEYIANDYVELSHEKIVVQRNDFMTICREWLQKNLSETCIKQKDYKWVGLTDEDISNFVKAVWPREATAEDYIRAIEAKLKEKNTNA